MTLEPIRMKPRNDVEMRLLTRYEMIQRHNTPDRSTPIVYEGSCTCVLLRELADLYYEEVYGGEREDEHPHTSSKEKEKL